MNPDVKHGHLFKDAAVESPTPAQLTSYDGIQS